MELTDQVIIPAARSLKDFEWLMKTNFTYVIVLDIHIAQLVYIRRLARDHGKRLILHADMVQGLRTDEAAAQFLCQVIKPAGLISTHSHVISTAKKHKLISIQRIFLLDSHSLDTSFHIMKNSAPDFIEVLPGMMPQLIKEVSQQSSRPIFAGGFIRTMEDVDLVLSHGAAAITTSSRAIWNEYQKRA